MRFIFLIFLFLPCLANANTVQRFFDYEENSTLTSTNLNGNFNNIVNELNGNLDNNNADTAAGFRFIEIVSSLPAAGNQGRIVFLTSDNLLHYDTGSQFISSLVFTGTAAQGDTTYYNGTIWSLLNKSTTATRYLSNTGTSNNPEWAQVEITNGVKVSGQQAGDLVFASTTTVFSRLPGGSNGQILRMVSGLPAWSSNLTVFTSSGTFVVPTGISQVYVTMCARGGDSGTGSGSANGGGGGGGSCMLLRPYTVTPGNSYTVTIGTTSGSATSFDTALATTGGAVGGNASGGTGGTGGAGATGTLNATTNIVGNGVLSGGNGGDALPSDSSQAAAGAGGGSYLGKGGNPAGTPVAPGYGAGAYGSVNGTPNTGGSGIVIVMY